MALGLVFAAAPLEAQTYRDAFGIHIGGSQFGNHASRHSIEPGFTTGWITGFQIDHWIAYGRTGLRFNTTYADRALSGEEKNLRVFSGDFAFLIRPFTPNPERLIAPYFAVGPGMIHAEELSVSANFGLGLDLLANRRVGIQVEATNQFIFENIAPASLTERDGWPTRQTIARATVQFRGQRLPRPTPEAVATPEPRETKVREPQACALSACAGEVDALTGRVDRLEARADRLEASVGRHREEIEDLQTRLRRIEDSLTTRTLAAPSDEDALFTVQVGAFRDAEAARALRAKLISTGFPVWISQHPLDGRTLHRVRLGALAARDDAEALERRIRATFDLPTWVTRVDVADALPEGAVQATQNRLRQP